MQLVRLDEGEAAPGRARVRSPSGCGRGRPAGPPARSSRGGRRAARAGRRRRRRPALGGDAGARRRARRGAVPRRGPVAAAHPPRVRWTARRRRVRGAPAGRRRDRRDGRCRPATGRRLVGLDAVAGEQRWSRAAGRGSVAGERALPPARRRARVRGRPGTALRPARARRRGSRPATTAPPLCWSWIPPTARCCPAAEIPGWVVATAQAGSDLVVATYAWGMLTVRRLDPATGAARWQTQRWSTFQSASNGRVSLVAAAGLVLAAGNDVTLLLDAATGERLPRPKGATRGGPDAPARRRHAGAHPVPPARRRASTPCRTCRPAAASRGPRCGACSWRRRRATGRRASCSRPAG